MELSSASNIQSTISPPLTCPSVGPRGGGGGFDQTSCEEGQRPSSLRRVLQRDESTCEGPTFHPDATSETEPRTGCNRESCAQKRPSQKAFSWDSVSLIPVFLPDRQPRKSDRVKKTLHVENSSEVDLKAAGRPRRSAPNLPHHSRRRPVLTCSPTGSFKRHTAGEKLRSDPDLNGLTDAQLNGRYRI